MTRLLRLCAVIAISFTSGLPVRAETVDFEDLAASSDPVALVGEEYADLGVRFFTDDGAIWGANPDWDLEGTDGPSFLGFDSGGYTLTADFDPPILDFELDIAAGVSPSGHFGFDQFTLAGYLDGLLVDSATVFLGDVNEWTTVSLAGEMDQVFWIGAGLPGMRFGIDRLHWGGTEAPADEPIEVFCDIKPGNDANVLNPSSRGVVPVVLYGSQDLDVLELDPDTLSFGPGEAPIAHRNGPHPIDLDGDGHLDLLAHYRVRDSGVAADATEACVLGATRDGAGFVACDGVTLVPQR